jgi:hypothetical protein
LFFQYENADFELADLRNGEVYHVMHSRLKDEEVKMRKIFLIAKKKLQIKGHLNGGLAIPDQSQILGNGEAKHDIVKA